MLIKPSFLRFSYNYLWSKLILRNIQVGIISAPFNKGQNKAGTEIAPKLLKEKGLIDILTKLNYDVHDYGDINCEIDNEDLQNNTLVKYSRTVIKSNLELQKMVVKCLKSNRICLTLGGDHSVGIGTLSGSQIAEPNMCYIWIDAHPDINNAETTPSGHIHGMSLSYVLNDYPYKYNTSIIPKIHSSSIAFIGLRCVDLPEKHIINSLNITHYDMASIDKLGINEVISRVLNKINPQLNRPIHVSFDIDSIDELIAPSTGTPVYGGLTLREALTIGERIYETKLMKAFDLVEINPSIGSEHDVEKTLKTAFFIIRSFFGSDRMGLFPKIVEKY